MTETLTDKLNELSDVVAMRTRIEQSLKPLQERERTLHDDILARMRADNLRHLTGSQHRIERVDVGANEQVILRVVKGMNR